MAEFVTWVCWGIVIVVWVVGAFGARKSRARVQAGFGSGALADRVDCRWWSCLRAYPARTASRHGSLPLDPSHRPCSADRLNGVHALGTVYAWTSVVCLA